MGNCKLEELKEVYKASHFLILASQSEGWPKAVAEAMFFGCIPVATAVSCVPWMLGDGSRGILLPVVDRGEWRVESGNKGKRKEESVPKSREWIDESVDKIIELIEDPGEMKRKSMAAQEWSQEYTLERFEDAVKEVLKV